MNSMNSRHVCPHCLQPLNDRPYLMSRDPNGELVWTPKLRFAAGLLLLFLIIVGLLSIAAQAH